MAMGMLRSMFRCSKQKPDRGAALPTSSSWIHNFWESVLMCSKEFSSISLESQQQ